jgi:type VI secretion system protein VasI
MRKIPGFVLLVLVLSLGIGQGDVTQSVLSCTTIDVPEERLACYDQVAATLNTPVQSSSGNWEVVEDTNPIDDTKTVILANTASEGKGTYGDDVYLVLRCASGELDVYINWGSYISEEEPQVTYRIGTQESILGKWYISADNRATFFSVNQANARRLINELAASDNGRFVAQTTPYNENPVTAVFDVSGLSALLPQLFAPCPE